MKKAVYLLTIVLISSTILTAQSKLSLEISGSYLSPTGDFSNLYEAGFGGLTNLNYSLSENIQLSVETGYCQFSFNNEKFNELLNDFFSYFDQTYNVNVESNITVIPVMLGGKYFFTSTNFRPYAALDLGVHFISVDGSSIEVDGEMMNATESSSETKTAWGIGVGFIYNVSPAIGIDLRGKLNGNSLEIGTNFSADAGTSSSSESSKSTMAFFSIGAGIVINL